MPNPTRPQGQRTYDPMDPNRPERTSAWAGMSTQRDDPEAIGYRYSLGEPDYLMSLRESSLGRLRGTGTSPDYASAMAAEYGKGLEGRASPGTASDIAYLTAGGRDMESQQRAASMQQAAGQQFASQDWLMRQRALMELIKQRELNRKAMELEQAIKGRQAREAVVRRGMGTIMSTFGAGVPVIGPLLSAGGQMMGGTQLDLGTGSAPMQTGTNVSIYDPEESLWRQTRARRE